MTKFKLNQHNEKYIKWDGLISHRAFTSSAYLALRDKT